MPLIKPRGGKNPESKKEWLERCYSDPVVRKEFGDDNNKIGGYCYTTWKDHKTQAAYIVNANEDEYVGGMSVEAEKKKPLNKPFRTPGGPKKFGVYVKNDKGNIVLVRFGDPNMEIKRDDPERRKSFRARHNCDNPGPKWKARYWSCRMWSNKPVSKITKASEDEEDQIDWDHLMDQDMILAEYPELKDVEENKDLEDQLWFMGNCGCLEVETDSQTGLAKWPLSFKRIEKDIKRSNKEGKDTLVSPPQSEENPPMAV